MADVAAWTEEELDEWVRRRREPLLVEFHSRYCFVCHKMDDVVARLADDVSEAVTTVKVDVTDYPDLPARYGLRTVPTMVLFRKGESVPIVEGAFTRDVAKRVRQALGG